MLLHLMVMLLARGGGKTRVRRKQRGKIVIFCPVCGKPGVAQEISVDQQSSSSRFVWERVSDLYVCGVCEREFNAEAFANDGAGIMQPKTWDCPDCGRKNLATSSLCCGCSFRMV